MNTLRRLNPQLLEFESQGSPPDIYEIKLMCRGLRPDSTGLAYSLIHRFRLELGLQFPAQPPRVIWHTPVFHPNISPPQICHSNQWAAGWSVAGWVQMLYDWARFAAYNRGSALNQPAADWAVANAHRLPLDPRKLRLPG